MLIIKRINEKIQKLTAKFIFMVDKTIWPAIAPKTTVNANTTSVASNKIYANKLLLLVVVESVEYFNNKYRTLSANSILILKTLF